MTYDEIVAAGIDTNSSANQHVYEYVATLDFKAEIDVLSLTTYFNGDGIFLGGYFGPRPIGPNDIHPPSESDPRYYLHYHIDDGYNWHLQVQV